MVILHLEDRRNRITLLKKNRGPSQAHVESIMFLSLYGSILSCFSQTMTSEKNSFRFPVEGSFSSVKGRENLIN